MDKKAIECHRFFNCVLCTQRLKMTIISSDVFRKDKMLNSQDEFRECFQRVVIKSEMLGTIFFFCVCVSVCTCNSLNPIYIYVQFFYLFIYILHRFLRVTLLKTSESTSDG